MSSCAERILRQTLPLLGLLSALWGCAERHLAPELAGTGARSRTGAVFADSTRRGWNLVIARLKPDVEVSDIEATDDCDAADYVPELRLVLFRDRASVTGQLMRERFASDPRLEYSETDLGARIVESRQSSVSFSESERAWSDVADQGALERVGAAEAQAYARGAGVLVAILDTGIELDHPALASQIQLPGIEQGSVTAPGDDRAEQVDTNGDGVVDGALGHGTHVAGIVHAIAPDARLLPVRVLDSDGVGDAFAVAHGIVAAVKSGALVINLSLGVLGASNAVADAIDFASRRGVTIVGAAGNSGLEAVDLPAAYAPVIAVAGTDSTDQKADFSSYGPDVDVAAPSTGILSTYVGGGYALWSGTSMAAPFASGIAALLRGYLAQLGLDSPSLTEDLLRRGSEPLATVDPTFGWQLGAGRVSAAGSVMQLVTGLGQAAARARPGAESAKR